MELGEIVILQHTDISVARAEIQVSIENMCNLIGYDVIVTKTQPAATLKIHNRLTISEGFREPLHATAVIYPPAFCRNQCCSRTWSDVNRHQFTVIALF